MVVEMETGKVIAVSVTASIVSFDISSFMKILEMIDLNKYAV